MDLQEALEWELQGKFEQVQTFLDKSVNRSLDEVILASRMEAYLGNFDKALTHLGEYQVTDTLDTYKILLSRIIVMIYDWEFKTSKSILGEIDRLPKDKLQSSEYLRLGYILDIVKYLIQAKAGDNLSSMKTLSEIKKHLDKGVYDYYANLGAFMIGEIYRSTGDYKSAIKQFTLMADRNKKLGNFFEFARAKGQLGVTYAVQGKYKKAREEFETAISILEENDGSKYEIARLMGNLGSIMRYTGDPTSALDLYYQALNLAREIKNDRSITIISSNIGLLQIDQGLIDDALDTYFQSLESYKAMGDNSNLAVIYTNIGLLYRRKGNLLRALEFYKKGSHIRRKLGDRASMAINMHGIGKIYLTQGDISIAIGYFEEAHGILQDVGNEAQLATVERDLGIAYQKKNDIESAMMYLQSSLERRRKIGNAIEIAESLFYFIMVSVEEGGVDLRKDFEELEKIAKKYGFPDIKAKAFHAEAMMLRKGKSLSDHIKAHELEERVVNLTTDSELRILAMLNLCEYLVLELKVTNEVEIINEIRALLDKLYQTASEQESYELLIKIMIIEAKLELIDFKLAEAITMLERAMEIAENKNIEESKLEISYLLEKMNGDMKKASETKASLDKRLDMVRLENYIHEVAAMKSSITGNMDEVETRGILDLTLNLVQVVSEDKNIPVNHILRLYVSQLSKKEILLLLGTYLMLDFMEKSNGNPSIQRTNIQELLEERIDSWRQVFDFEDINLTVDIDPTVISIDTSLISRVFDNLIHNGLKFTPKGGEFKVQVKSENENTRFVFSNSSEPLNSDILETLCDRYVQYEYSNLPKKGLGLGLAFCKAVVSTHQGVVKLYSPRRGKDDGFEIEIIIPKST